MLKIVKNLKTVIFTNLLYNLIVKFDVISHGKNLTSGICLKTCSHAISRTYFIVECVGERLGLFQFGHVVSRGYLPHVCVNGDRTRLVHTHQQHAVSHLGGDTVKGSTYLIGTFYLMFCYDTVKDFKDLYILKIFVYCLKLGYILQHMVFKLIVTRISMWCGYNDLNQYKKVF